MEEPPVYASPKRSKSKVGWIIAIIFVCIACCCGGPSLGIFTLFNKSKSMLSCVESFKDISVAVRNYAAAHKGVLPNAATWQDDVRPDLKRVTAGPKPQTPFPSTLTPDGDWACVDGDGKKTGISYNSELSGKKMDSIADQVSTIMLFETEKVEKNQHGKYVPRDFQASPKLIFSAPRGWVLANVAGQSGLVNQTGRFAPVPLDGSRGGGGVEIISSSSDDDAKPKSDAPPKPTTDTKPKK